MTRDVLIRISGARVSGSDQEDVEMITTGDYFLKDGKHYIIYEEIAEDDKQITKNTIKVAPDSLDILKRGNTNTHMIFQKNKKNISCYMTPFGELVVGIHTNEIHVEEEKDALKVDIRYALDINYEHVSNCNITVQVTSRNTE